MGFLVQAPKLLNPKRPTRNPRKKGGRGIKKEKGEKVRSFNNSVTCETK